MTKRLEIPSNPGVGRPPENPPPQDAVVRAFIHDVVNPLAAIRISLGALRARTELTAGEMTDLRRIEEAAGKIIHLVTTLEPSPARAHPQLRDRGPVAPAAPASVDLYVLCCELAELRRSAGAGLIHCRAFGDPRGDWDRGQVVNLLSGLLDHAIAQLGQRAPITVSVTGMPRHVRVDIHGLGWLSDEQRESSVDLSAKIGGAPPGATVTAIASRGGGVVFRLRLPRRDLTPREESPETTE